MAWGFGDRHGMLRKRSCSADDGGQRACFAQPPLAVVVGAHVEQRAEAFGLQHATRGFRVWGREGSRVWKLWFAVECVGLRVWV